MPVIIAQDVHYRVNTPTGTLSLLEAINFSMKRQETLAIQGPSGSGKSTLLALLAGLDTPTQGKIWLAGEEVSAWDEKTRSLLRRRKVGFIFQSFLLIQGLTALENVQLPAELAGQTGVKQRALTLLEQVGLSHRLYHYPSQLSGGEQQRVAIARAFMNEPEILFADEPTGNLDDETGANIEALLFELNQTRGATLVIVTHHVGLAHKCQRQVLLSQGRLTEITGDTSAAVLTKNFDKPSKEAEK